MTNNTKSENNMKKIITIILSLTTGLIILFYSCSEDEYGASLKLNKVNRSIMEYLQANQTYSILVEALEKTELSSKLNLAGNLTMFVPPNDAFENYFQENNISGLSAINDDVLRHLLLYHIYIGKFGSSLFQTGSLPAVTVSGDLIKMDISQGLRSTYLNNTVAIDSLDIPCTNGVVHVIDKVLVPPVNTIYDYLESDPQYSIMAEAIRQTGTDTSFLDKVIYDSSMIVNGFPSKKWITAFFETNEVLNQDDIFSFDDLAKKYSNTYYTTKDYTNRSDSLNIFIRYHAMERKFFISDFRDDFFESMSFGNWLIFDTKSGLNINKHDIKKLVFNPETGQYETITVPFQVDINMEKSNQVANNGIVHSIESILSIYNPSPIIVKAFFCDAPGGGVITLADGTVTTFIDQFANMNNDPEAQKAVPWLKWGYTAGTPGFSSWGSYNFSGYVNNPLYPDDAPTEPSSDWLHVNSAEGLWIELTTKPIFKGTYTLYLYYRNHNVGFVNIQQWKYLWSLDDFRSPDMVDMMKQYDAFGNDIRLCRDGSNSFVWLNNNAPKKVKLGVFTFDQIETHTFRIDMIDDQRSVDWIKIQFEPVL